MDRRERIAFAKKCRRDPVWWSKTFLGVDLVDYQRRIIESIRDNERTTVKACHAPGKSFTAADAALWFLNSYKDSIVITTAPTWRQVEDVLWREMRNLYKRSRVELGGKLTKRPPTLELGEKWYAVGLSPNDEDAFAGWHAPYMLIICDEASGIPTKILNAIKGLMASGHVRLLLLGNPLRPEGEFYHSFGKLRNLYNPITIGAFDTPNLINLKPDFDRCKTKAEKLELLRSAPIVHPKLINARWVASCLEEFGEDSDFWQSRVLANFPEGSPNQLIPLYQVEDAASRRQALLETDGYMAWFNDVKNNLRPVSAGFDPARMGGDETAWIAHSDWMFCDVQFRLKLKTQGVIDFGRECYLKFGCTKGNVDSIGYGGGPSDLLGDDRSLNYHGMHVGKPALNPVFLNIRAESYWALKKRFESGEIWIPRDDRLIGQLSTLRYETRSDKKIKIESKDDMRKRGLRSPDRADAMMLSVAEDDAAPEACMKIARPENNPYTVNVPGGLWDS